MDNKENIQKDINSEDLQAKKTEATEAQKEIAIKCWLSEFESLQNEKVNYQRMQHNLVWVNISALGIILTAITAEYLDILTLLALPFISGLLGLYWVTNGIQTSWVTHYVQDRIAKELNTLSGGQNVMEWENYARSEVESIISKKGVSVIVSPLSIPRAAGALVFVGSCLLGLGLTVEKAFENCQWEIIALWVGGCLLTLYLIVGGCWLGLYWFGRKHV